MRYEYHVIRKDGIPFTIQSERDLFWDGWHKLAHEMNIPWAFVQQWQDGRHLSTIHNRH